MAIAKGKKRYQISMNEAVVNRFQALARELGMPPSVLSAACEDAVKEITNLFQIAKEKGTIEISDMFKLMGQQMELTEIEEKEKKNVENKRQTAKAD